MTRSVSEWQQKLMVKKIYDRSGQRFASKQDFVNFLEALKTNQTLEKLILTNNQIGAAGAFVIAEVIKSNNTITELNLWKNHIGDDGASAIANAMKENTTITVLILSDNEIGDAGARVVSEAIRINNRIVLLDLHDNQIADAGASALAEAMKINNVVTKLFLWKNHIGAEGARAIAETLNIKTTISLTNLDGVDLNKYDHFLSLPDEFSNKDNQQILAYLKNSPGRRLMQLFKSYFPDVPSHKFDEAMHLTIGNSGVDTLAFGMDLYSISRGNGGQGFFLRGIMGTIRRLSHIPLQGDGVMVRFLQHMKNSDFNSPETLVHTICTFANGMQDVAGDSQNSTKFGMNRNQYCRPHSTREDNSIKLYMNKLLPLIQNLNSATERSNELMQAAGFSIGTPTINSPNYHFCYKSFGSILVKSFAGVHLLDTIRTRLIYRDLEKAQSASRKLRNILDREKVDYTGKICSGNWNGVNIQFRPIEHVSVEVQFEVSGGNRSHEIYEQARLKRNLENFIKIIEASRAPPESWQIFYYILRNLYQFFHS